MGLGWTPHKPHTWQVAKEHGRFSFGSSCGTHREREKLIEWYTPVKMGPFKNTSIWLTPQSSKKCKNIKTNDKLQWTKQLRFSYTRLHGFVSWNVVCPVRLFIEKLVFWSLEPQSLSITARNRHKSRGFIMVHLVHHVSSFVKYQHPMTPFIADTAARHFVPFYDFCQNVTSFLMRLCSWVLAPPVLRFWRI